MQDYDYEKSLAVQVQKKVLKKREQEVFDALKSVHEELRMIDSLYVFFNPTAHSDLYDSLRESLVDANRAAYRALNRLKELSKERAEWMRLKND